MMSNTSNVAAAPITASTNTNLNLAPAGLVSSHPLTTTGLPLTSAPHAGLTNVNNNNTFTHTGIAPLPGTDAMIAPVASHITLPAPVMAPGQPAALLHGGSGATTLGQMQTHLATPVLAGDHHLHGGEHHHSGSLGHHTTTTMPAMTTGSHHAPMLATGAPLAAAPLASHTTTTHSHTTGVQPTTTTTTTEHHGGLLANIKSHLPGHHATTDGSHTTDKKLMEEREKESHRLAKEQEKLAKERSKEQVKHEKELHKAEVKAEKEHLKEEKRLEKEHKKHEKELAKEHSHDHHHSSTHQPLATKPGMMAAPIQPAMLPAGAVVVPTYAGSGLPVAAGQGYANPLLTDAQAAAVEIAKVNQLNTAYQPIAATTMGAPITATTTTQPSAMHTAPRF